MRPSVAASTSGYTEWGQDLFSRSRLAIEDRVVATPHIHQYGIELLRHAIRPYLVSERDLIRAPT